MEAYSLFEPYIALLLQENDRQNLISRRSAREDIDAHIRDSVAILDFWPLEAGQTLIDIGSGAGFPGLMLALARPQLAVTLLEADLKKSEFLNRCVSELALPNVAVLRERAEVAGQSAQWRGHFDLCSSRAVALAPVLLEYGLPLLKVGGRQLMWKSRGWEEEMNAAQNALAILGGELETVWSYDLTGDKDRVIVAVRKIAPTPEKYPRRDGIPAKRPL